MLKEILIAHGNGGCIAGLFNPPPIRPLSRLPMALKDVAATVVTCGTYYAGLTAKHWIEHYARFL